MSPARPRSAEQSRAAILAAARARFGADGFERTTIRSIATEAGVDPALVMRYFTNKDRLFAAAAEFELHLPDLTGVAPAEIAAKLMPRFFAVWEDEATFLPLLRAAATSEAARAAMLTVFTRQVTPALAAVAVDQPARRAAWVGSQILGLAFVRYLLQAGPLTELSHDELQDWLAPVFNYYLTGQLPIGKLRRPRTRRE